MAGSQTSPLALAGMLRSLGLTKYEALVYIALLREPGATATRIHELAGVPRASVYPVLDRLIQKNMVSASLGTPRRFEAVPPETAIDHLLDTVAADAARAKKVLSRIWQEREQKSGGDQDSIWSIYGAENIRVRLADLLRNASASIDAVIHGEVAPEIATVLCEKASSIPVRVATWHPERIPCPGIRLRALPRAAEEAAAADLRFSGGMYLIDSSRAIVVLVAGEDDATALYSESRGFVRFFSTYFEIFSSMGKSKDQ
ncbi:MAG: helix-turn-helix domain-containing protein [Methanolinea sp.]|nr:helix-turn-helix domain-containing protein [Methanolinea sp.]